MIIKRLKIVGLYGFLNKDIEFNSTINLLVGINGSGKTSLLTTIKWLTKPALPELCTTEFELLELEFIENEKLYTISCTQSALKVELNVRTTGKEFADLPIELRASAKDYANLSSRTQDTIYEAYTGLTPNSEGRYETWSFISGLSEPTNVSLDRQLYLEDNDRLYVESSRLHDSSARRRALKAPNAIKKVNDIFRDTYDLYRKDLILLNEELRNKLLLSLFESGNTKTEDKNIPPISLREVRSLEKRVKKYFSESILDKKHSTSNIDSYFKAIKQSMSGSLDSNPESTSIVEITNKFQRVSALLAAFNEYEKSATKAYSHIDSFLATVNNFLADSSKKINFEKESGLLYFDVLDNDKNAVQTHRNLMFLSSGEQQLVILLAYIAFASKSGKALIIDEPEISLHPKWQEDFIDAAERLLKKSTQLIMATHSPAIVGKHRKYCIVLYPNNR